MTFKYELINPELAPWCEEVVQEVIIVSLLIDQMETEVRNLNA